MKFRLVLRGSLPPDKRGTVDAKQRIRRELHPQLRALYQSHPTLNAMRDTMGGIKTVDRLADNYGHHGWRIVPIVREKGFLAVSLDFLILRRDEPHRVFSGTGDLDGRVKTLIDGLRMPQQKQELGGEIPAADEDPFFCLLQDDKLIYDFSVTTDRLLVPADPNEPHRDIVAIIGVHIKTATGAELSTFGGTFGVDGGL